MFEIVKQYEKLESSQRLKEPEIRAQIEVKVREILTPAQLSIEGVPSAKPDVKAIVDAVTKTIAELTIDIPKIIITAANKPTFAYDDFDLDNLSTIRLQPVSQEILIQQLRTSERSFLLSADSFTKESKLEDYLVRALIDVDEVDYESHSALLYKLSNQLVAHLKTYLPSHEEVENVLLYHQKTLLQFVVAQLLQHCHETETEFEGKVKAGFTALRPNTYNIYQNEVPRDFRAPIVDKSGIKRMLFTGFAKCCYPLQKFDSDSERRFAMLLEDDQEVVRWMKPALGHFHIDWRGQSYNPDFVVETKTEKFICEPKAENSLQDDDVLLKAKAAARWCHYACAHALENGGKPWNYLLIPHNEIESNRTLNGLKASFSYVS